MVDVFNKLKDVVSAKFISNDINIRHAYSRVVDSIQQGIPEYVIRPKDANEISEILKIANESNVPVIPRGGGCCEFGGSKPLEDSGIVLDMKRMKNILNLDTDNLVVTVEAGISWAKLNEYLSNYGLYTGCLGPGSGLTASVGGGISHHSVGGGGGAKYGPCTKHVVSMEVVLPQGEIIETGSQANKFSTKPFNRYGNGPDLASIFMGDNGIMGVKTKVSLKVYPKPPYVAYKTYLLPRKSLELSSMIFNKIRHKGIEVYDSMYFMDLLVSVGVQQGIFPLWEDLKRKRGIMFYTIEANSEVELAESVKELDKIFLENKAQDLGPEISDGNIGKWHYEEQGHWLIAHNLWGLVPGFMPLDAECKTSINSYPKILKDLELWDMENSDEMKKILDITGMRPISGAGPIILIEDNTVELTAGFTSFESYHKDKVYNEIKEINMKLWKSMLKRLTKHGVSWYMCGDILSRLLIDMSAFDESYLNFMKNIKNSLDPNHVLSRGKFNFW